ncbi:MAG: penicillin-binding protein [Firmicutes bacterium]|nr:penicillin-binding protein [Bacillota bacterium]
MKLLKQLKNRYNILSIILVSMLLVLFFKLATLTVVRGDELREKSDDKRLRELSITAPRGEIRDRYGRLLAGNKPSFTVQILKDELNSKSVNRNDIILNLVRILEKEGESYIDEFPIKFNEFQFNEDYEDSYNVDSAEELIIDRIVNQGFIGEFLEIHYEELSKDKIFSFIIGEKARLVLRKEGIDAPILVSLDKEGEVEFQFDTKKDIEKWKRENNIEQHLTAKNTLIRLINDNENILRKILSNSVARKLSYELLESKGMTFGIDLIPYSLNYDRDYNTIKRSLASEFSNITMDSDAKEDFISIAKETLGVELLNQIFEKDENKIIVADMLRSKLEEDGVNAPVKITANEESGEVIIEYISDEAKDEFNSLGDEELPDELSAKEALFHLSDKYGVLDEVITNDDIKYQVQKLILEKGVNPQITVSNWEYVPYKNKVDWLKKYNVSVDSSIEEVFQKLRDDYDINEELTKYEARYILVIIEQLNKQGYKAYEPINIAYGIENKTIAEIEENNVEMKGVEISVEPVRYYPNGQLAAHTLGYMGKISQSYEIQEFLVDRDDYSPNDIIGKIGIEKKYEKLLNGVDGAKRVEVDAFGNTIKVIEETKAIPGDNIYLTMDSKLQKVAEDSLKQALEQIRIGGEFESEWGNYNYSRAYKFANQGAVVAIDVKTGEVLAMANYPSYDPNLFATGISNADWESLKPEYEEDGLPLFNVAIKTAVQPGSTFKMLTALAGLELGLDPEYEINDRGYVEIGNTRFGCWYWNDYGGTHGYENLYDAIKDSCNYYFFSLALGENQRTGKKLNVKVEIDDIIRLGKEFGLNDKTGIEIDGEASGRVPNPIDKVEQSKRSLKSYLKNNLHFYIKDDLTFTKQELDEKIDQISNWVELEEILTRGQVVSRLDELGFDGLRRIDGIGVNLVDMIKYTYLNYAGWKIGDTLNVTIGQGDNKYTPIQMANYIATIANGGYRHNVSIIDKVLGYDNDEVKELGKRETTRVNLNDYNNLTHVQKGMAEVTKSSSAGFVGFPVKVAAKTGTAERDGNNPDGGNYNGEEYDNYAWYVAYAPYDDPQIAVATVIFQGGSGGYASPVAKEIIAQYLGLNNKNEEKPSFENKLVR